MVDAHQRQSGLLQRASLPCQLHPYPVYVYYTVAGEKGIVAPKVTMRSPEEG